MKKTIALTTFLWLVALAPIQAQIQYFEWQNVQRQYLVKIPAQHDETIPVLYFLHGLGDNITRLDNEFHFQQIADDFGWMMVVPQALNEGFGTMWNAGLSASTTNDSGFLMALLDSLSVQYPVNQDSVFFTGFSMGGFMTHRMAIEHGDRITACAPVSGLIAHPMASHVAVSPVKMLHIHGTNDPVVGYDGNSQYFGYNLGLSVEAILNYWINANHCNSEPVIDTLPDLQNDGLRFVRYTYEGDAELQHLKVIGGTHTWYHGENQYDISYLNEIRKFFTKNANTTSVDNAEQDAFGVWPNPNSGQFVVEVELATEVEMINLQGKTVARLSLKEGVNHIDVSNLPSGLYLIKSLGSPWKEQKRAARTAAVVSIHHR